MIDIVIYTAENAVVADAGEASTFIPESTRDGFPYQQRFRTHMGRIAAQQKEKYQNDAQVWFAVSLRICAGLSRLANGANESGTANCR